MHKVPDHNILEAMWMAKILPEDTECGEGRRKECQLLLYHRRAANHEPSQRMPCEDHSEERFGINHRFQQFSLAKRHEEKMAMG